ncbi:MAG: M4 family metallopeptidase [Deltaproteobacteria bacterium]|nr:MAG: M4 family metallopeptidase [Deltaproteobacteria bacterium]
MVHLGRGDSVLAPLFLSLAVAGPAQRFVDVHPASSTIRSGDGRLLVHASGFLAANPGRTPESAARNFLSTHGGAFGVAATQELVLRQAPAPGLVGAVRLERTVAGLPVFGGDVVVGVDAQSRVFLVNTREVAQTPSGRHALGEAAAVGSVLSSLPADARGTLPVAVAAGWRSVLGSLRAVYRVDLIVEQPSGSWRVFVDAETGSAVFRESLRYSLAERGNVYSVSPAETSDSLCPLSGKGHTLCASPVNVTIPNLVTGADLRGTQATVSNCNGADFPNRPGAACNSVPALTGNNFNYAADSPLFTSTTDNFSAVMAYFHLDKHVSFFKTLDPTLPGGTLFAVNGSLPAFVNVRSGGQSFENAFYDGIIDAMVFGQGAHADYAYDATVMYHELTHGVVQAWGGFDLTIDALGSVFEGAGLNEGTADSMAVSETGRSALGAFLGATETPPVPSFRDMNDPDATRSCQGNGSQVSQFGVSNAINGLNGEEHSDGEIWNGFYWEIFQGLRAAGVKGCGGSCDAGPEIQYKALQLAAGPAAPTFNTYWQTFKAAAAALFPQQPFVAEYVGCVAKRRKMDSCDRTVPVYAGETKLQLVRLRYSPFQTVIPATAATGVIVCSNGGAPSLFYARKDQPVKLGTPDPTTGDATVMADLGPLAVQKCSSVVTPFTLRSAGNWQVLLDLPGAFTGPGPGQELYLLAASASGIASRPAASAPSTCSAGPLAVIAPSTSVPPRGRLALSAAGGSNTGFSWSFTANRSGGSIDSTGAYTAGPTGSVTDTVKVIDSANGSATRDITVTAGVSISPASPSVGPKGTLTLTVSGGSGSGFTWSLTTNASGGSIVATSGVYTAGPAAGVTDVVGVTDSLGNTATANVSVRSTGGGCASGDARGPAFAAVLAAILLRRRRPRSASSGDAHP